MGSEWRTFGNDKSDNSAEPSRVKGAKNPSLNGSDLSTLVEPSIGDASLDEFDSIKYKNIGMVCSTNHSLLKAYKKIDLMANHIDLPRNMIDRANVLFKQIYDDKNFKGHTIDAIASASLYIACRQEGVPRPIIEIYAVSKV